MIILEELRDEINVYFFGKKAHELNTSYQMLMGRHAEDGISISDLLIKSKGDFHTYQELIQKKLSTYYCTDFYDFSLLMGKFFEVYNLYCYLFINRDIRKRIINNSNINQKNTLNLITNNYMDIYNYLKDKFEISEDNFSYLLESCFVVRDNSFLYNNPLFHELAFILIGNYLYLDDFSIDGEFVGSKCSVDYLHKVNKKLNNSKVI